MTRVIPSGGLRLEAPTDPDIILTSLSDGLIDSYAYLRLITFRDELAWTHSEHKTIGDVLDAYDSAAHYIGIVDRGTLTGAIRLVIADSVSSLPSGRFLTGSYGLQGDCAELSKGVVEPRYRHCGVLTTLIAAGIHLTRAIGIGYLIAGVVEGSKGPDLLGSLGFKRVAHRIAYVDSTIVVPGTVAIFATTFPPELFENRRSEDELSTRLVALAAEVRKRKRQNGKYVIGLEFGGGLKWLGTVKHMK